MLAMRRSRTFDDDSRSGREVDWQLQGQLRRSDDGRTLVVPTRLLDKSHLRLDTGEPSVNYGTLGADLASSLIAQGLLPPRDDVSVSWIKDCVRRKAPELATKLHDALLLRVVNRTLGVKLAHRYIQTRGDDAVAARSWLFFMRLCQDSCYAKRPLVGISRRLCNTAVMASPKFRDLFNCSRVAYAECFEGAFSS